MKKIALIFVSVVTILTAYAQDNQHFLSLDLGGGMHTMLYKPADGKWSANGGGLVQLKYQYIIKKSWGIGIGVGLSSLRSSSKYNYTVSLSGVHPDNNEPYTSTTVFKNWCEYQDMIAIDIPIQAFYNPILTEKWSVLLGFGLTLDFPVWMQYSHKGGEYVMSGYFPCIHGTVENMPNHGFGITDTDYKGKIGHKVINLGAIVDFGALYNIAEKTDLYFGLYVNYQFLNTINKSDTNMLEPSTLDYTNVLNSNKVDKVNPIEVGLKLGFRFNVSTFTSHK